MTDSNTTSSPPNFKQRREAALKVHADHTASVMADLYTQRQESIKRFKSVLLTVVGASVVVLACASYLVWAYYVS